MLTQKIKQILTPKEGSALIYNGHVFQLKPLFHISALESLNYDDFKEIALSEDVTIFNGIVYLNTKKLKLKSRIEDIISIYKRHISDVVGDKGPLIELYQELTSEEISSLVSDHIIFSMKKNQRDNNRKALVAMRYLPEYQINFENNVYTMPPLTIYCVITKNQSGFNVQNPQVVGLHEHGDPMNHQYDHPFVYRDCKTIGHNVCLGDFRIENSHEFGGRNWQSIPVSKRVSIYIRQCIQILVSGYNRSVTPANNHLYESKYNKYITERRRN